MRFSYRGPLRLHPAHVVLFTVRHLFGTGVIVWLSYEAFRLLHPSRMWLLVPLFGLVYVGFAVYSGHKLFRLLHRAKNANQAPGR